MRAVILPDPVRRTGRLAYDIQNHDESAALPTEVVPAMADPPVPQPADDRPTDGDVANVDQDVIGDPDEVAPVDVSDTDRFAINGRDLPLADFIASTMSAIPEREPVDTEPPPSPQEWDIIWATRRPLQQSHDADSA